MRFRIEQRLPAPLPAAEAAFVDPRFLERLVDLPKIGGAQLLDQERDGDLVHQRVRYAFTGHLSSAARAVIDPKKLSWVEESTLDRATHRTTWRIVPDHYPDRITCSGTFSLEAVDERITRRTTDADIQVHLPLLGRRVEEAIVSGLREHAEAESAALDAFLAEADG